MIARMKQLREQREKKPRGTAAPAARQQSGPTAEPRFKAGDTVFCLPYGNGVVNESRIEFGQEMLDVEFPDYGPLTIDPAISLVRLVEPAGDGVDEEG